MTKNKYKNKPTANKKFTVQDNFDQVGVTTFTCLVFTSLQIKKAVLTKPAIAKVV